MGKPGKYFNLFFRNPERRQRMWEAYIHHKSIYAKGQSEVGFFNSVVGLQAFMVTWLFARDLFPGLPVWIVIVIVPAVISGKALLYYSLGLLWERDKVFDVEHQWNNKRDPMLREIRARVEGVTNGGDGN